MAFAVGLLRWLLLTAPCQVAVEVADRDGSMLPRYLVRVAAGIAAGGALATLPALAHGTDTIAAFLIGGLVVLGAVLAWVGYALAVLAVLWLRGRSPEHYVTGAQATHHGAHASAQPPRGWRRVGIDRVLPATALLFLAFMAIMITADAALTRIGEAQYQGATARAQAQVVGSQSRWFGAKEPVLIVRFPIGQRTATARISPEELPVPHSAGPGARIAVEYPPAHPDRARPAGTAQRRMAGFHDSLAIAGVFAVLAAIAGGVYLVEGARRPPPGSPP